VIVLFV
jgi:hypothetical protein